MPDGNRIDPDVAAFNAALTAAWAAHPPLDTLSLAEARAVAEQVRERWRQGGPAMAETRERRFPTDAGPMRYRMHVPEGARDGAALVYLHGGGFTLFSIDTHDRLMREYAQAARLRVTGLDYALAPEHRFPAALDQVVAFVRSVEPETRLALGGDSAGANLALAAATQLRDAGEGTRIAALLLNYGAFSPHTSDAAEAELGGPGAVLNRAELEWFWSNYLALPEQAADPRADLLRADLSGLPPALIVVPDRDVLAEQSLALAARMGGGAELRVYHGATHSFLEAMSIAPLARRAIAESAAWLKERLQL